MTDLIITLITDHKFLVGFMAGGIICGFSTLAIGWEMGHRNGWLDAIDEYTRPGGSWELRRRR